jgi:carbonic anhydrase
MIDRIDQLLCNNRRFVEEQLRIDPAYSDKLAEGQHPGFLWIGCSDRRVPPFRRLVALNVIDQVYNLGKTSVQQAWKNTRRPGIHGWVFDLDSGHILPQTGAIDNGEAMHEVCKFHNAVEVH